MASSSAGVKRSNTEIFTQNNERPTKSARVVVRHNPFDPLLKEIWIKIFAHILPGDIRPISLACWEFSLLRLPCFYEHLREKKELSGNEIQSLHPPLTQFLIYNDGRFDKPNENNRKAIQRLWTDYSVPKIFPYIIFHCPLLETLDLRHPRFSFETFLGGQADFKQEVATLDMDLCSDFKESSEIDSAVAPMLSAFDTHYPLKEKIHTLKILKAIWDTTISSGIWDACAEAFPNLEILVLEQGPFGKSITDEKLREVTRKFPRLTKCRLIKIDVGLARQGSLTLQLSLEQ